MRASAGSEGPQPPRDCAWEVQPGNGISDPAPWASQEPGGSAPAPLDLLRPGRGTCPHAVIGSSTLLGAAPGPRRRCRAASIGQPHRPRSRPKKKDSLAEVLAEFGQGPGWAVAPDLQIRSGLIRPHSGPPHPAAPCLRAAPGWRRRRWRCGSSSRLRPPFRRLPPNHRRR